MKKKVKTIYLDKYGYRDFIRDLKEKRSGHVPTVLQIDRDWNHAPKRKVDGIDYYAVTCHSDFWAKDAQAIAERYGFPVYEEMEWFTI